MRRCRDTVRFIDRSTLRIGGEVVTAKDVLIATGAKPRDLPIPADMLTTSEQFLDLASLPRRLVMIGGGYISFEFAHVAAVRAGAQVTIVHQGTRPLEQFDADPVDRLVDATRGLGITVLLQTSVKGITRTGAAGA